MVERQLTLVVDPATFKFALSLFQEAASGRMSGSHINKPLEPGLHLTNIPMNRGMLAIVRETRHLGEDERQALMLRVMHFAETIQAVSADARFAEHVCIDDSGFQISDEFIEAYSSCKFTIVDEHIRVDSESLAMLLKGKAAT